MVACVRVFREPLVNREKAVQKASGNRKAKNDCYTFLGSPELNMTLHSLADDRNGQTKRNILY